MRYRTEQALTHHRNQADEPLLAISLSFAAVSFLDTSALEALQTMTLGDHRMVFAATTAPDLSDDKVNIEAKFMICRHHGQVRSIHSLH